jgi:acetyltransferase-like isoleucine patch superfamily enzyme
MSDTELQNNSDKAKAKMKFSAVYADSSKSSVRKYRDLYYGDTSFWRVLWMELIVTMTGGIQGALGLWIRSKLYPLLFAECGRGVIFGKNITIRHPDKIRIGDNVVLDDNCVIDAKGETNKGIVIGGNVFIGRNTIVYCKNGDMEIKDRVSISPDCTIMSANQLTICEGVMVGGYTYMLSGGEYDYSDKETGFYEKCSMPSKGDLVIGRNCWIGASVTVLDGASIGDNSVIGACSLVNKPIPQNCVAYGVPAKAVKSI